MAVQNIENYGDRGAADLETILSSLRPAPNEKESDFFMPGEWEAHSVCLILFPHNPETFCLQQVSKEIANLAIEIATKGQESVCLLCKDEETARQAAEAVLSSWQQQHKEVYNGLSIYTCICPSNDTWARDTGPTFVFRKQTSSEGQESKVLIGLDWDFNAYGGPDEGCYWPCSEDQKIAGLVCSSDTVMKPILSSTPVSNSAFIETSATSLAKSLSIHSSLPLPIILEGGSFHTDGEGTLLTTCECLLHPNRNQHLTQEQIETVLKTSLGVNKVLWLPYGLDADNDTNGHVDNFCCFAKPGHVILAWTDCQTSDDELSNYQRCRTALKYLESVTDAQGRKLSITKLYLPDKTLRYTKEEAMSIGANQRNDTNPEDFIRHPGEAMAASYINFYIANKAILVPQFASSDADQDLVDSDQKALETLRPLFPGRKVVGVPSREILLGGGNIHCQTQQVPSIQ